jgi:formylglycine-generating enzyme required for sulfatase activity
MTKLKTTDKLPRAVRGGGWGNTNPAEVRAACRGSDSPSDRYYVVGFRTTLSGRLPR